MGFQPKACAWMGQNLEPSAHRRLWGSGVFLNPSPNPCRLQVVEAADVKQRLAKNCAKYAANLETREKLHLLLRIARFDDSSSAMRDRSWSWVCQERGAHTHTCIHMHVLGLQWLGQAGDVHGLLLGGGGDSTSGLYSALVWLVIMRPLTLTQVIMSLP